MIFWVAAGVLALAVAAILIVALRRGGSATADVADYDRRVYRDQLREIERDAARGIVAPDEAQRLRSEVARRLLEADRAAPQEVALPAGPAGLGIALGLVAVIGAAVGMYLWLGQPTYPDMPLHARIAAAEARREARPTQSAMEAALPPAPPLAPVDPEFVKLVEQLRMAVAKRPDDLQGHQLLARNEANLGNFAAAHRAQARVIELKGDLATEGDLLLQATLMIQAAQGQVSPDAEIMLTTVLQRNPQSDTALFFGGIANMQIGRHDLAFRLWRQLLDTAPPDSPWLPEVRNGLESLAQVAGVKFELPPEATSQPDPNAQPDPNVQPGPDAAAVQAAEAMSPEDRQAMIRGMVEGLNDRLATQGGTAGEWARLITALGQLGETDRARAIFAEAKGRFAGREADLAQLQQAAEAAGVAE